MRGAIAAGHPLTAEAGARVLAEGGTAVDACIAAGFASWAAESMLSGPGSGGFMLVKRAGDPSVRLIDFFVAVPGLGRDCPQRAPVDEILVEFDAGSSQPFSIGAASCAVPGALAGLERAHRRFGTLPWRELIQPALELARDGIEISPVRGYLHRIPSGRFSSSAPSQFLSAWRTSAAASATPGATAS